MNPKKNSTFPLWMKIIFPAVLIILIAGGAWFFKDQQNQQRHAVEDRLMDIAQLKIRQIVDWRQERLSDAAVLMERRALLRSVQLYLSDPSEQEAAELKRRLQPVQERYHFDDILVVDVKGNICLGLRGTSGLHPEFKRISESIITKHEPMWIDLHMDQGKQSPHLSVVAPLFSPENDQVPLASLVMISDATQFLFPLIQSWPTSNKTAETLLIRRDGDNVLFLNELRHQKDTALQLRIPISQADLPAAMAVQGESGIVMGKDYRGVDVIAAILPVPDSPWFMVAKMDVSEAFSDWHFRSIMILLGIIGTTVCVIVSGLVFQQRSLKSHYQALYQSEAALRETMEKHSVTLNAIGDAVISTDAQGRVEFLNPVAEALTGWKEKEARGRPLHTVFRIINEETGKTVDDPVRKVLQQGVIVGLANHTMLISRQGEEIPIADSGAPIRDENGQILGVVLVFRDQSQERLIEQMTKIRLSLIDFIPGHSLEELLTRIVDQCCVLLHSPAGYYHLLAPNQKTAVLSLCSSYMEEEHVRMDCNKESQISRDSVWSECLQHKKPVVHNQFRPNTRHVGSSENSMEVQRELVVPVLREGNAVALLGVGNKTAPYAHNDILVLSELADVTWEIVRNKQAEIQIQKDLDVKELLLRELYHRTKNNMQIISSMLRLKSRTLKDKAVRAVFQDLENKIQAMALVHKKLYESHDLSSLNLNLYFSDLIDLIRGSFLQGNRNIRLKYRGCDVPVLIDTAIPLGLVLNELVTNSIKHAFPNWMKGEILIRLDAGSNQEIVIEVQDTGVGLPEGFDVEKQGSLGLETVLDLTRHQLGAEITFENRKGLLCRIVLKNELYERRV